MTSISFSGYYRFNITTNNKESYSNLKHLNKYLDEQQKDGEKIKTAEKYRKHPYTGIEITKIVSVPDEKDSNLELFCIENNIPFRKLDTAGMTKINRLKSRIAPAPEGKTKANIDLDKFEEVMSRQSTNFKHCKSDYENYYKDDVDYMLKSGEEIPASTLYLTSCIGSSGLENYVELYGADKLNKNTIIADFNQETDKPDHCIFEAFKDLGMKKIPVYMDDDSFEIAKTLGILSAGK